MSWSRCRIVLLLLGAWLGTAGTAMALEIGDGADSIRGVDDWWREFPQLAAESEAEQRLLADAADGVLDDTTLMRAALISSGVTADRRLADYEARFELLCESLAARMPVNATVRRRAQFVLEFLHASILVGHYGARTTRVDAALDHGHFNCVSSAILYRGLAERFDLDVRSVELPGHVRCVVHGEYETLVVEPTCANWFEVMDNRADGDRLVRQTTGYRNRPSPSTRQISPIQLVAMVYYNNGIERLRSGQFDPAVTANLKALALDSASEIVQGNLLAAVNNWALELAKVQQFDESVSLLERGLRLAPSYEHFRQNDIYVHQHWMDELWSTGGYDEAQQRLSRAWRRRPGVAYFDLARLEGFRREAAALLERGDLAGAVDVFEMARACDHHRWHDMEARLLNRHAAELVRNDDFEGALQCLNLGLERLPNNALLARNRQTTASQWVTSAYQQQDYSEGLRRCRVSSGSAPAPIAIQEHVRFGYHHWLRSLVREGLTADAQAVLHEAASVLPNENLWQEWQAALNQ